MTVVGFVFSTGSLH